MGQNVANGLLGNLIAYWPGNEANGDLLDAHTNALHLTDINTVTSEAGIVYPAARQYTQVNYEYHTRPGDDALLSTGDVDFTLAAWARFDAMGAAVRSVASKWNAGADQREYWVLYDGVIGLLSFRASSGGVLATVASCPAVTFGAPAINTWYLIVSWHDSVANTINIQINNGAIDSVAYAAGIFDGSSAFQIGSRDPAADYMSGRIGPTMFWKSAPGNGGVLTEAQRTALWNGGAGLAYAAFN